MIVKLRPDEMLKPKVSAITKPDGSILSMPLEDMTPLLPLEQLEDEMLIGVCNESIVARK